MISFKKWKLLSYDLSSSTEELVYNIFPDQIGQYFKDIVFIIFF